MKIVSTMGSGSLGRELDLEAFVSEVEDYTGVTDSNFTSTGMVTIRLEQGGPAYTFYRTGTFQIRGAENTKELFKSARQLRNVLTQINLSITDYEFNHVTSVFMENFDRDISLETLAIELGMENTEYEPEQFPGLIYRPSEYNVTMLIFASGKVIIGGTSNRDEAIAASESLNNKLLK